MPSRTGVLRWLALIAVLKSSPVDAAGSYSLDDLQALGRRQSWLELLEHARDIPPTKRNALWNRLVERAAVESVGQQKGGKGWLLAERLAEEFPALVKSVRFIKVHRTAAFAAARRCYRRRRRWGRIQACTKVLTATQKRYPTDVSWALATAALVARGHNQVAAFPFYAAAVRASSTATPCKARGLAASLIRALSLPVTSSAAAKASLREAVAVARRCYPAIKAALIEAFYEEGRAYRDATCGLLRQHNAVRGLRLAESRCGR